MDNFDKRLSQLAKKETIYVPSEYNERVDNIINVLDSRTKNTRKKVSLKILLAAAIILVLTTATVFAAPIIINMAGGKITYFNDTDNFKYLSQKAVFEKFNGEVGASVEDKGIKLTINNIAADDNYINVFYTITSNTPIKYRGDKVYSNNIRANWTAPAFKFKANGKEIEPPNGNEDIEAKWINEYSFSGMQRRGITGVLPDKFNIEIYTNLIGDVKGTWYFPLTIDKTILKSDSLTITPGIKATVTSGIKKIYKHDICIDKVSISPFGSQIVISENVKTPGPFSQFALVSDTGKFLSVIPRPTRGGKNDKFPDIKSTQVTNSFEFLGGNTEIKSIKLIPYSVGTDSDGLPAPKLISKPISEKLPIRLELSENGTIVIDEIKITKAEAKIIFHTEGIVYNPHIFLLDDKGKHVEFDYMDNGDTYNRETLQATAIYKFVNASDADIAKIKKVGIYTQVIQLNQTEAITIPLK